MWPHSALVYLSAAFLFSLFSNKINVLSSNEYNYNLPESHVPFYFRNFPDELKKCVEDEKCPYKNNIPNELPCWGYEADCQKSLSYSIPECPKDHKGWAETKSDQVKLFYQQGDFGYVKKQADSIMVMCEPTFKDDTALECSKHMEFCRGRNIMMNFTSLLKRTEPFRYKMDVFSGGDFGGHCHLHKERMDKEADHMSPLQSWAPEMRFFTIFQEKPIRDGLCDVVLEKPAFIMKIDATVNMYHHFCDFFNLYASLHLNISHPSVFNTDVHIIIWETYPYRSNFADMWKVFTKNKVLTLRNFSGKTVCFRNVVFPLLPRMIFGLYYNTPLIKGCEKSGLFKAFSEFVLHRLNIHEHVRNNSKVHVTLLSRETAYRNILNEKNLISALEKDSDLEVRRIVFNNEIPFRSQLEVIRNTDILIGIHGAGLTHLLFLPDWAAIFELYNCEDENCYLDLARLRGVKYITWQKKDKITAQDGGRHPNGGAHAKFANYAFDVTEFQRLVNVLADYVKKHPKFREKTKHFHDEL
ncbi:UNVERIFIED_CONTAM: hypothetical protein PYX00_006625 [Menopon gallinae]|uniref:EGF domain-specific O-linked N-acetylglucosamine transferase n=1 Tax=Menopon gallinae TaxID=328185 RepID=A0AAW2HWH2_9NEOP